MNAHMKMNLSFINGLLLYMMPLVGHIHASCFSNEIEKYQVYGKKKP
jgi:hypothetical protein